MATESSILAPENPTDRGAWRDTIHGAFKSDMTEVTKHTLQQKHSLNQRRSSHSSTSIGISRPIRPSCILELAKAEYGVGFGFSSLNKYTDFPYPGHPVPASWKESLTQLGCLPLKLSFLQTPRDWENGTEALNEGPHQWLFLWFPNHVILICKGGVWHLPPRPASLSVFCSCSFCYQFTCKCLHQKFVLYTPPQKYSPVFLCKSSGFFLFYYSLIFQITLIST